MLQRPYVCTLEDCNASYRRKDHLNRHLLQHQGKNFKCPIENCKSDFSLQSNLKRHLLEMHDENSTPPRNGENQKRFVCPENGCGKVFRYASQLQKHEDSHGMFSFVFSIWISSLSMDGLYYCHLFGFSEMFWHNFEWSVYYAVMLETVDVVCLEPGCLKHFTNSECLKAHVKSCHQYVTCDTCGTKQLKKNMKRHLRTHEIGTSTEPFKCEFKDCDCTFSTVRCLQSSLTLHSTWILIFWFHNFINFKYPIVGLYQTEI